jgi:hypothetical protein
MCTGAGRLPLYSAIGAAMTRPSSPPLNISLAFCFTALVFIRPEFPVAVATSIPCFTVTLAAEVGPASLSSLAIVMWELLNGLIPWKGMDIVQIIQKVRSARRGASSRHCAGMPAWPLLPLGCQRGISCRPYSRLVALLRVCLVREM